ncbi:hypothetical protein [Microcoleus sp. herbarium2]
MSDRICTARSNFMNKNTQINSAIGDTANSSIACDRNPVSI